MDEDQPKERSLVSSKYTYQPLDTQRTEIRLLRLLPSTKDDQTISCVLGRASLDDELRYTALSYCWGDPTHHETIRINNSVFHTTRNLRSALWYIRKHLASGSLSDDIPRLFWIDAICINQEDQVERGHQVSMMRHVYASATNVLSWLGDGGDAPDTVPWAFDFIRKIVKATQFPTSASSTRRQQLEHSSVAGTKMTEDGIMVDAIADPRLIFILSQSTSVIDFFSLEYWHRVWIVQELVLTSPEDNIIVFGDELMSCRDVQIFRDSWLAFLKNLQLNREWEPALTQLPDWNSASWTQYLQRMEESLVVWSYYDFMRGLLASEDSLFFVILSRVYNATDPRDSVFALLGMIPSPRVVPNYEKPATGIYFEWFVTVLEDWQDFQPLYFSGPLGSSYFEQLPSWVPDLSRRQGGDSPVWDATLSGTIEMPHQRTNFTFGEPRTPAFPRIYNERILHARGVWYDEVVQIKRIDAAYAAQNVAEFCKSHLSAHKKEMYKTGIPLLHAIFRVLMCGINRFNPSLNEAETSVISRASQLSHGTNQLQLHKTMPLLQAVAKFLNEKGSLSPDSVDDFVLDVLCKPSLPLGSSISDVQLAAAFITFMVSGQRQQDLSASSALEDLGLTPGPGFLTRFLQCFFQDTATELEHEVSYDIFQDETAMTLVSSLQRYFTTFDQTIFVTATGHLGNGPAGMAVRDRVAILNGAKMPFVLRQTPESVVLVGPCYVEGLSDGEPAGMARRGEVTVEDIFIS